MRTQESLSDARVLQNINKMLTNVNISAGSQHFTGPMFFSTDVKMFRVTSELLLLNVASIPPTFLLSWSSSPALQFTYKSLKARPAHLSLKTASVD